jgi:hypothetical protein
VLEENRFTVIEATNKYAVFIGEDIYGQWILWGTFAELEEAQKFIKQNKNVFISRSVMIVQILHWQRRKQ